MYVAHGDRVTVVDGRSGTRIGTDAAAFAPLRHLAFSSNRNGALSVIAEMSPNRFQPLSSIRTEPGARTMALDPTSGRIDVVAADVAANATAAPADVRRAIGCGPEPYICCSSDPKG